MSKFLMAFLFGLILVQFANSSMMGMMNGPKCESFCPGFCDGKCSGSAAKPSCNGETCHCGCSASTVSCKLDECQEFCNKHSGGRVSKAVCMKGTVCKCNFGDPSKEGMNILPMPYPITSDVRAEVRIAPE